MITAHLQLQYDLHSSLNPASSSSLDSDVLETDPKWLRWSTSTPPDLPLSRMAYWRLRLLHTVLQIMLRGWDELVRSIWSHTCPAVQRLGWRQNSGWTLHLSRVVPQQPALGQQSSGLTPEEITAPCLLSIVRLRQSRTGCGILTGFVSVWGHRQIKHGALSTRSWDLPRLV